MDALAQRIRRALLRIDGVVESPGMFTEGDAFWVNGTEIAHAHGGVFEIRLTRRGISAERARLKADPRVELRSGSSDWIAVRVEARDDVRLLAELAAMAAAAHLPLDGTAPKPPPVGAALARRRRFH